MKDADRETILFLLKARLSGGDITQRFVISERKNFWPRYAGPGNLRANEIPSGEIGVPAIIARWRATTDPVIPVA